MSDDRWMDRLSEYLDGELAPEERRELEAHLARCATCKRTLEDLRAVVARAAALSMIPTSTGAAKAVGLVLPELSAELDGFAMRVPTPSVSVVDLVALVEKPTTVEEVNAAFKKAAEGSLKGILQFCEEELVSADFRGNSYSSIVDAGFTKVIDGDLVKVTSWYDNEWGYSCRVRDLIKYIAKRF